MLSVSQVRRRGADVRSMHLRAQFPGPWAAKSAPSLRGGYSQNPPTADVLPAEAVAIPRLTRELR
jgi:hypothetical protein